MGQILFFLAVLAVSGWGTVTVRRHGPTASQHRVYLYMLIWLVPFLGTAIAAFIVFRRAGAYS